MKLWEKRQKCKNKETEIIIIIKRNIPIYIYEKKRSLRIIYIYIWSRMNLLHAYQLVPYTRFLVPKIGFPRNNWRLLLWSPHRVDAPATLRLCSMLPLRLLHFEIQVLFRRVAIFLSVVTSSRTCSMIGAIFFFFLVKHTRFIFHH